MTRHDKTLVIFAFVMILSLLGNVFALSYYFGQQTILKKYETLSQQKAHDVEAYAFSDLALSISPEGREILGDIFAPHLPEIIEARSVLVEKQKAAKTLVHSEEFTKEQFLDAVADMSGAQQKFQDLIKDLFVEAAIALPEQDRKILAKNFRKAILSNLMHEIQE